MFDTEHTVTGGDGRIASLMIDGFDHSLPP